MAGLTAAAWAVGAAGLCLCLLGLLALRWRMRRRELDVDALYALSPAEFERYVAGLFAAAGYETRVVGGSGDGGVDVRVWRDGWTGVVQCKRYRPDRLLSPAAVRELVGTRAHERVRCAWLATTAPLSPAARQLAAEEGIGVLDASLLTSYGRQIHARRWLTGRGVR
jgi:restriction system protein